MGVCGGGGGCVCKDNTNNNFQTIVHIVLLSIKNVCLYYIILLYILARMADYVRL